VPGNTSQKTRAPNTAAEATNQSSIAAPDAGHHEQERQQQQHYSHHRDSQQQLPEDHCNLRIRGSTGLRRKEQQIRDQNPNLSIDLEWSGWLIAALTDIKFRQVC
jgi:hypothetical protein